MKATTRKSQKKSTAPAKKAAKTGQIMASASGCTSAPKVIPAWARKEVKGLMDALSGR